MSPVLSWVVLATGAQVGSRIDSREAGPFMSRAEAERCATSFASDGRCWERITIEQEVRS